ATTSAAYQVGVACSAGWWNGSRGASHALLSAQTAMAMVMKFSHEKLPDRISQAWVAMMTRPATPAAGWGANSANGTTTWAMWLASTSTRWARRGRWWKSQLSGFGMGWVSWW